MAPRAPLIAMMKAVFATALLALVGVTAAPLAAASTGPGMCAGVCVEITSTEVSTEIHNNVQTCAGNVNVQVGVNNEANYCSGGNNTNGGGLL
jgi:hypothetical protein